MKVLIVGGSGYVGSILRPALEAEHDCRCFDARQGDWPAERTVVGDVHDDDTVRRAVHGMDAVLYLAMGARRDRLFVHHIDLAFSVNVAGAYRFLRRAMSAGAKRFIYASSLSVFQNASRRAYLDEQMPPDGWNPYSISKRLAEQMLLAGAPRYPKATILALRLMWPRN